MCIWNNFGYFQMNCDINDINGEFHMLLLYFRYDNRSVHRQIQVQGPECEEQSSNPVRSS